MKKNLSHLEELKYSIPIPSWVTQGKIAEMKAKGIAVSGEIPTSVTHYLIDGLAVMPTSGEGWDHLSISRPSRLGG